MKAATHTLNAKQKMCYNLLIIVAKLQSVYYNVNSPSKHHRIYGIKKYGLHTFDMQRIIELELGSKTSISKVPIFSFLCC